MKMTVAEKDTLHARELSGVRLSCQILCDHDMTVRAISRLEGSGRQDCGHRPEEQIHPQPVEWTEKNQASAGTCIATLFRSTHISFNTPSLKKGSFRQTCGLRFKKRFIDATASAHFFDFDTGEGWRVALACHERRNGFANSETRIFVDNDCDQPSSTTGFRTRAIGSSSALRLSGSRG